MKTTWAEINLDNIKYNLDNLKKLTKKDTLICGVVKANAYGHGLVEISKFLESQNVDYLAVARVDEAIKLRENNVNLPILVLGYTPFSSLDEVIKNNIIITVYSLEIAQKINYICKEIGKKINVHIKVDTGMNRLGINFNDIFDINSLFDLDYLNILGVFTHLATADEKDLSFCDLQIQRFENVIKNLPKNKNLIIHLSNSAMAHYLPKGEYNMIRYGISLYGYHPDPDIIKSIDLKPALTLKTKITNIKKVKKGEGISYNLTYKAKNDETIVTLGIGYADGFFRNQKNPKVIIKGEIFDVVGRICMDQCMVRVDKEININIDDEVIVFSSDKITANDVAKRANTISYEVLTNISDRVKRIYKKSILQDNINLVK